MKLAKVIPIFKSGDPHIFGNYRPISLLPSFSKILEKTVSQKLMDYLNSQKLLYKDQYGFRSKHSTYHPILNLLNQITTENDKPTKNYTVSVFIDLSKAFDTISHKLLLKKLERLGIRGTANLWFKNYLSDRKQYMDIDDIKSDFESIACGVPQGSILGPILFLIYVNDISRCTSCHVLSFADDTTISLSGTNIVDLYNTMNQELEHINQWFQSNKLCLNVKKTKHIVFRPVNSKIPNDMNIVINNQTIDRISNESNEKCFKFLGLHMDEHLSWKFHISKVCKKIASANYVINKVKNIIPYSSLKTLYSTLVHSHISYGLLLWGSSISINQLYIMQKRTLRIIHKKPYRYHTAPLFKLAEILNIHDLYTFQVLVFMHKLKFDNWEIPESLRSLPYFNVRHQRHTRNVNSANCKTPRTTFSSLLPYHKFPRIWNDLGPDLNDIPSPRLFKKAVKSTFLDKYPININCMNLHCRQCQP